MEITAKSAEAKPDGVAIEISVYADRYAGSRPVLTIKEVWIPWALLVPETPAFGIAPPVNDITPARAPSSSAPTEVADFPSVLREFFFEK